MLRKTRSWGVTRAMVVLGICSGCGGSDTTGATESSTTSTTTVSTGGTEMGTGASGGTDTSTGGTGASTGGTGTGATGTGATGTGATAGSGATGGAVTGGGGSTTGGGGTGGACTAEVCNGLDDDCDGTADNGDPESGAACAAMAAGVCAQGTEHCTGGVLQCVPGLPSPEQCDGADNDCDGVTDEGNPGGGGACMTGQPGVCAPGTLACTAGQVQCTPNQPAGAEVCDGLDNDCNGQTDEIGCAPPGSLDWATVMGPGGLQQAVSVGIDAAGNIAVCGSFDGGIKFGAMTIPSAGNSDVFVAKLDPNGSFLWAKTFGNNLSQSCNGLAMDSAGNIALAVRFTGSIDFGGGALTNASMTQAMAIAKLDANGAHVFSKKVGFGWLEDPAFDPSGNMLFIGRTDTSMDFGGGALATAGLDDIVVAKLDPTGAHLWSKRFGDAMNQYATSITSDSAGNVIFGGFMLSTVSFGGPFLTADGRDAVLVKLDPSGGHVWSKLFSSAATLDSIDTVAVDPQNNILFGGQLDGPTDFGGGALVSAGQDDMYVVKLTSAGAHVWSKRFGDIEGMQYTHDLASDAQGNVLLVGSFWGTVDFGGGPLINPAPVGSNDMCFAKFDPAGNHIWSKRVGDTGYQGSNSVVASPSGHLIAAAYFGGTVNFGQGFVMADNGGGSFDAVVLSYAP